MYSIILGQRWEEIYTTLMILGIMANCVHKMELMEFMELIELNLLREETIDFSFIAIFNARLYSEKS